METSPGPGSREALGFQDSLLQAESIVVGPETGAPAADLQELEALSTSLSTSWQSGSKPRSEGARASVLTTTAVTGWPGMSWHRRTGSRGLFSRGRSSVGIQVLEAHHTILSCLPE